MTLETVMSRLENELSRCDGPVDVRTFVHSFYPHDIEAGQHRASLPREALARAPRLPSGQVRRAYQRHR